MTKRFLAALVVICALAFAFIAPASAQSGGVATGGTMALRQGVPHAQTVYEDQCRRIGAYNHPMCMTGNQNRGNVGRQGYQVRPGNYGRVGAGYYGSVAVPRARAAAPPPPPPSPEQVYQNQLRAGKVTQTRTPVDCVSTHTRVEGSNRCQSITWVPGED